MTSDNKIIVRVEEIQEFCSGALETSGARHDVAHAVAENLTQAELWGIESHGLSRLPIYLERLVRRSVNPTPDIRQVCTAGATAVVDGDNGPGAAVGAHCMDLAVDLAKSFGIGLVLARGSNHYGVAGSYTLRAISNMCIGITGTNAPSTMAVWGGREKVLGTNPLAVGVPGESGGRILLDMSASVVAKGKIIPYLRRGNAIPPGWALDVNGSPTTDPKDAWDGLILPFAGPKGSGFAVIMDILSGVLSGANYGPLIQDQYTEFDKPQGVGHFFIAVNVAAMMPISVFNSRIDAFIALLKGSNRIESTQEIVMPGEIELRREAQRREDGIAIEPTLIAALRNAGDRFEIPMPGWLANR